MGRSIRDIIYSMDEQRLDLEDPRLVDYGDGLGEVYLSTGDLRVPFHRRGIDDPYQFMGRSNSDIVAEVIRPALAKRLPGVAARVDLDSEYGAVYFTSRNEQDLIDLRSFIVGLANQELADE